MTGPASFTVADDIQGRLMIRVLYFARVREELEVAEEELPWQEQITDVASLIASLCRGRGETWQRVLSQPNLLFAVNQSLADMDHPIREGDEVAFFPPVTGG